MSKKTVMIGSAVATVIGIVIGTSGTAAEEPIVETKIKTVTETVEVEVVPSVCIDALARADEVFGIAAEFGTVTADVLGYASNAFMAAAEMDWATMRRAGDKIVIANGEMDTINAELDAVLPMYTTARDDCRAAE